jgi:hypothetical protein
MYRRVMYRGLMAVVLVAVAVTLASSTRTPTYEASAQVWVDWQQGDQQMELANQAGSGEMIKTLPPSVQGLQTIILTIIHTIHTRPVAEETIARLGLRMEPAELLDNLTVEQLENTSFIALTYEGTDPHKATQIVNTVGQVSSELISERSARFPGSQFSLFTQVRVHKIERTEATARRRVPCAHEDGVADSGRGARCPGGLWACAGQSSDVPVENGVQQVWLCGEKKGHRPLVDKMLEVTPGNR